MILGVTHVDLKISIINSGAGTSGTKIKGPRHGWVPQLYWHFSPFHGGGCYDTHHSIISFSKHR